MSITPAEEAQLARGALPLPIGTSGVPQFQTFDRRLATSTVFAPTSGTLTLTAIMLPAGFTVTGITFVSGSTAESGGTHLWYALYKADLTLMAQSADDTGGTSFGANTAFRKALATAQVCPYSGMYYLGFMGVATNPTLLNVAAATANANGSITGMTPILAATSSAAQTTTAPNPAGALTAIANALYAFVD